MGNLSIKKRDEWKKLREKRPKGERTQTWLAKQIGISKAEMSNILKHGVVRNEDDIEAIEKVLLPDPEKVRK